MKITIVNIQTQSGWNFYLGDTRLEMLPNIDPLEQILKILGYEVKHIEISSGTEIPREVYRHIGGGCYRLPDSLRILTNALSEQKMEKQKARIIALEKELAELKKQETKPPRRTKKEVIESRKHSAMGGCCDRFADQKACDCLEKVDPCPECNDSGWNIAAGWPGNGFNRNAKRCSKGCPSRCSICNDPECDNPGGQH